MKYILLVVLSTYSVASFAEPCNKFKIDKEGGPESVIEAARKSKVALSEDQAKYIYGYAAVQMLLNKEDIEGACLSFKEGKQFQVGSRKSEFKSQWKEIPEPKAK